MVKSVYDGGNWLIRPLCISGVCSRKRLARSISTSPLDGMLVHRRVTPNTKFASTHSCTEVERDFVRVKCLAQEHETTSLARALTRTHDREAIALIVC